MLRELTRTLRSLSPALSKYHRKSLARTQFPVEYLWSMTILGEILQAVRDELQSRRAQCPPAELRARVVDAPHARDFHASLTRGFGLIAEVKRRSPSVGEMRGENVEAAPEAYESSQLVRAVSVLTNQSYFGMPPTELTRIRAALSKPVLRKDFILDEYQIREARVLGADAILLMANVLDASRLKGFYDLARELGMEALFEVHELAEIKSLPTDARIVGINSRKFKTRTGFVGKNGQSDTDFSIELGAFGLVEELPKGVIRVAESGLSPETLHEVASKFDCALVGTSLLRDERGPATCLEEMEELLVSVP